MVEVLASVLMEVAVISSGVALFAFYMVFRNELVYSYRINAIRAGDGERYDRLPSYHQMLWQLWRFDWSDYLDGRYEAAQQRRAQTSK